jgi:hypothetical protein
VTEIQDHAASRSGIRAVRPAAGSRAIRGAAGVFAILSCATACAGGASTAASGQSSSPSPAASLSQPPSAAPATSVSPAPGTGATVDRSTAGAALTDWMRQVVRGDYAAACQDMGDTTSTSAQPVPYSAVTCSSSSAKTTLAALHGNFTTDGITPSSDIKVVSAPSTGTSETVSGTEIQVSGTTLTDLMVAHSTGVKPGQLSISFVLSRLSGAWYVTDMNMNV